MENWIFYELINVDIGILLNLKFCKSLKNIQNLFQYYLYVNFTHPKDVWKFHVILCTFENVIFSIFGYTSKNNQNWTKKLILYQLRPITYL